MASGVDATKTPTRSSHESAETTRGKAIGDAKTPNERLDHSAMEMAERAEKRLKDDDKDQTPGDSIFTK